MKVPREGWRVFMIYTLLKDHQVTGETFWQRKISLGAWGEDMRPGMGVEGLLLRLKGSKGFPEVHMPVDEATELLIFSWASCNSARVSYFQLCFLL